VAIHDFGTVRCFSDAEGVDVYFGRGDEATRARVRELKGGFNPAQKRWRIVARFARKSSEEIVDSLREALEAAAPEWWTAALPKLAPHACVTRKYGLKIGIGGMRLDLPPGHPLDYTFENSVPGAVRDGRSWLVPPDAVRTTTVRKAIERVLSEDKKIFAAAASFIGPRRIAGNLALNETDAAALRLAEGALVAADRSFFAKADPEMPVDEMIDWCLLVERLARVGDVHAAVLRYADLKDAFLFLRTRRADPMPPPALGGHHALAKFEKQKQR
jgi:hypothetical protein